MSGQRPLIFDLDGTLIDSAPDIHANANAVLAEFGMPPLDLGTVRGFVGRGVPHLVARLLEASGQPPEGPLHAPFMAEFNRRYTDAVTLTRLYPGVAAALGALHGAGHPLAICTNKPIAATRAVLDHFGLTDLFRTIVGGDSLPVRKPDPAPLHLAVAQVGGGDVLYVGDSEVDAETATRAALPFALFTEGYRKAAVATLPHVLAFDDYARLVDYVSTPEP